VGRETECASVGALLLVFAANQAVLIAVFLSALVLLGFILEIRSGTLPICL
jgi:hypothetical protein